MNERIAWENKSIVITACSFGSSSHVATSHREASRVVLGKGTFGCPSATPPYHHLSAFRIHSAIGMNPMLR